MRAALSARKQWAPEELCKKEGIGVQEVMNQRINMRETVFYFKSIFASENMHDSLIPVE